MLGWRGREGGDGWMRKLVELLIKACGGGERGGRGLFACLLGVHLEAGPAQGGCWLLMWEGEVVAGMVDIIEMIARSVD